jgi:hypothetical protein
MKLFRSALIFALLGFAGAGRLEAGILVDHQPLNSGGPASDTDFINDSGFQRWQQLADDVLLSESAEVTHLTWWGFYGGSFSGSPNPPVGDETMRIRFYDARPGDGLPGEVLYEESYLNPTRTWTGRIVGVGSGPREYRFNAALTKPFAIEAGVPYWFEVVQVGDVNSAFRWEYSIKAEANGFVFRHTTLPNWQHTVNTPGDLAFQLISVPEPQTALLFLLLVTRVCSISSWIKAIQHRTTSWG